MLQGFLISHEKGGMEDGMDLPSRGVLCLAQIGTSEDLKASWQVMKSIFRGGQH